MLDLKEFFKSNDQNVYNFSDLIQKRKLNISNGVIQGKASYNLLQTKYFNSWCGNLTTNNNKTLPLITIPTMTKNNLSKEGINAKNQLKKLSFNFQDLICISKVKIYDRNIKNEFLSAKLNKKLNAIKFSQDKTMHEKRNLDLLKLSINFNKITPLKVINKVSSFSKN